MTRAKCPFFIPDDDEEEHRVALRTTEEHREEKNLFLLSVKLCDPSA
jgi:hypothetical protein